MKLNHKIIKQMCGTVSFKKGDSFYKANKVTMQDDHEDSCTAIVHGVEDFYVTVSQDERGRIQTSCSCPPLLNYTKDCQHIAAVLIAIYEHKRQAQIRHNEISLQSNEGELANDFISLFNNQRKLPSGSQDHFEKRTVLDVQFKLKPVSIDHERYLFSIELQIGQVKVQNIRGFLEAVKLGNPYPLSREFTYDQEQYCFNHGPDSVLHQLILISRDEDSFYKGFPNHYHPQTIIIPPTAWHVLSTLLSNLPFVLVEQTGHTFESFTMVDGTPPLQFTLQESDDENYQLSINGFEKMIVFEVYGCVLFDGKLFNIVEQDFNHILEIRDLIKTSKNHIVQIPSEKLNTFFKKIVPSLRKIGEVLVADAVRNEMLKVPLVAKIYLDRLKNRLLVGLEFQYDNIVIQPLENNVNSKSPFVVRDFKREEEILKLMDESGFTKTEGGYFMQNEGLEYDFLVHVIPKLQKLAQIYATNAVRNRIIRNNHPKIRVKVQKERTNWLEFKFEMNGISDQQIKDILAALELKQKYYRLPNGSLLSLETKEMEDIRRFLEEGPIQEDDYEAKLERPMIQSLKFLDMFQSNPVFQPEESFENLIDSFIHPNKLNFEVPESLEIILRDYQKDGYKWMKALAQYGFGGVLADDMGLGKTVQSITYIVSELSMIRNKKKPVLIVCPSSLTYNWLNELMTFAPELEAIVVDGDLAERVVLQQNLKEIDVLITSYPLLRHDATWYEKQTFHTIFFDEAQAFKNPMTQTARSVKKLKADHQFALTGTPIENSLEELWSIFHVVFPQLFRGLEDYSHLSSKTVARKVRPFLLRRVKKDVLREVPKKQESLEYSELHPEQRKLYAAYLAKLRQETLKHLDRETFDKNKIRILAGLTRLRQICCHPTLFVDGYKGSSGKFERLMKILEESRASGRRVLIFSQFTKMLDLIGRELTNRGQTFFYLDGQTPSEERVELCNRFNTGERDIFLISLKAGGTGLNLTGADTVILYDLWWNPAVEEQAVDRAHRMGQKNAVQVIKLVARGTIEEKMNQLQDKKRHLIADVLETDENSIKTLTKEDIKEILMI